MKDPAFLFYPNDWLGGCMGWSFELQGAYLNLLILQFNRGKFTEALAKHLLSTCFDYAWPVLREKFKTDGTYFWNDRLNIEVERRQKFSESRRLNALGTKEKETQAKHMPEHMETEIETVIEDKKEGKTELIYTADFMKFWAVYPIKEEKKKAFRLWQKAKDRPAIELILEKIEMQKKSDKWQKGFVPMPSTYINNARWDDEIKRTGIIRPTFQQ